MQTDRIGQRSSAGLYHRLVPTRKVNRSLWGTIAIFILLSVVGCFMGLPFFYSIIQSLKPMNELFLFPPRFYVKSPTLLNFFMLTQQVNNMWVPFSRYLFNSLFVTITSTVGQVLFCSMAAYILSKGTIKGIKWMNTLVVTMLLFIGDATSIARYMIMSWINILDTYLAIILPALASPLGLFLMKQFMQDGVPNSLVESARIDGASPFRIYWSVAMPIARPVWMTMIIFAFQTIWSQEGLEYIYNESLKMLPTLFRQISAGGIARAGVAAAAAVILIIPPIFVFVVSQNKVIDTMAYSGIK